MKYESIKIAAKTTYFRLCGSRPMWEYHLCFFTKNRNNNNKTLFFGLTNNTIGNNNSLQVPTY